MLTALACLVQSCTDADSYQQSLNPNYTIVESYPQNVYYVSEEERLFNSQADEMQLSYYNWY